MEETALFYLRLSETFDPADYAEDIDLPMVPDVGDTIEVEGDGHSSIYLVKARRFRASFHAGHQIDLEKPKVLLHVAVFNPR